MQKELVSLVKIIALSLSFLALVYFALYFAVVQLSPAHP
jgi:hypothetical protein